MDACSRELCYHPRNLTLKKLQEVHEAHPGATYMKRTAHTFIWWPEIDKDIEPTVKGCHMSSQAVVPLKP